MEALFTILLFITVMVIAAVVFAGWVTWSIVRAVLRSMLPSPTSMHLRSQRAEWRLCRNTVCQTPNPVAARYCRRCGKPMAGGAMRLVRSA